MRKIVIFLGLLISVLLLCQMSHAELLVADDFKGKLKDKYWKGQKEFLGYQKRASGDPSRCR